MKRLLLLAALAACGTPPLKLLFELPTDGSCGSQDCNDVTMSCTALLSIRILDPNDPNTPYDSQCVVINTDAGDTLCPIAGPDLGNTPLPEETLEVQVVVYALQDIPERDQDGNPVCPANVQYTLGTNVPMDPRAAFGGRAYYNAGDSQTVVTLGCPNADKLVCPTAPTTFISTEVLDFAFGIPIDEHTADNLDVYVGKPTIISNGYALQPGPDRQGLTRRDPVGSFSDNVTIVFGATDEACIETDFLLGSSAPAVTCVASSDVTTTIHSWFVADATLQPVLDAAGLGGVPDDGFILGEVVDNSHQPVANMRVTASNGTVHYVTADGHVVDDMTTSTGIFYSTDAKYGTTFTTSDSHGTVSALSGRIEGKVSTAVLQLDHAVNP